MNITISLEGFVPKQAGNSAVQLQQFPYVGAKNWNTMIAVATRHLGQEATGVPVTRVRFFFDQPPEVCIREIQGASVTSFKKNPPTWEPGWHFSLV